MKLKVSVIFVLLIFNLSKVKSQNLLQNGSFDNYNLETECPHTDAFGSEGAWESQYSNKARYRKTGIISPLMWSDCGSNPCPCGGFHSPDIMNSQTFYYFESRIMNGASGNFVRMGPYELIQQKLDDNLETGNYYKINFRIFIFSQDYHQESKLKFLLSKNKIKYKAKGQELKDDFSHVIIPNLCDVYQEWFEFTDDYKEYSNNQTEVLNEYNLGILPTNQWVELNFIFEMPDQSPTNPLNWFTIDVSENCDYMCSDVVYIDDIELIEHPYCNWEEEPCSPTDGWIHTSDPFQIANHSTLLVTGLDNVYSATDIGIWIENDGGADQLVKAHDDIFCTNGIGRLFWNLDNLPYGGYYLVMRLENDCGKQEYFKHFSYDNRSGLPNYPFSIDCNNSIQTPIPCCESEPDIYIENETIEGLGELSFHAINKIEVDNTTVEANTENLEMKAGNEIRLKPGTHIHQGAYAHFYIEPCATTNTHEALLPESTYSIPFAEVQNEKTENELVGDKFSIYPNPFSSELHLSISYDYGSQIICEIYDLNGVLVFNETFNCRFSHCMETINTAHLKSGMYIVKLTGSDDIKSFKIIKQ
jgi:hypothetical protein